MLGELELASCSPPRLADERGRKGGGRLGRRPLVAYADPRAARRPPAVVSLSAWDTETDAKEAEAAARKLLAKLSGKPEAPAGQPAVYVDAAGDEWMVERKGDKLVMLFGAPPGSQVRRRRGVEGLEGHQVVTP